jgi:membrane peptidoglycan carboxypeptidase
VGYTPALSTAVWLGGLGYEFEVRISGGPGITGGQYPARIWGAFMNAWQEGRSRADFAGPPGRPGGQTLTVPGDIDMTPALPPPAPEAPPPDPNQPPIIPGLPGFPPQPQTQPTAAVVPAPQDGGGGDDDGGGGGPGGGGGGGGGPG